MPESKRAVPLLCLGLLLASGFTLDRAEAFSGDIGITGPQCSTAGYVPIIMMPYVNVNVTSPIPIVNVTLYYRGAIGSTTSQQPTNLSLYNVGYMFPTSVNNHSSLYIYQLPRFPNNTQVWAFVKVVDSTGNVAYSPGLGHPTLTCFFQSPTPDAKLQLFFDIIDVNPRYLNLTVSLSAALTNSETFQPIQVTANGLTTSVFWINQGTGWYFQTSRMVSELRYYSGIPQSYPLDSYQFYVNFTLGGILNYSSVTLNQKVLAPGISVPNVVNYSLNSNLQQRFDENSWILSSSASFSPRPGSIAINLQLTRKLGQVADPIIIPLFALYGLLGLSVFLRRDEDLANRLLVYISIFLFSYGLLASVNSTVVAPFSLDLNMAQLLTLALAPCTAILAGTSIVRWVPWIKRNINVADIVDVAGVTFAIIALLGVAQFSIPQYAIVSGTYHLVNVQFTLLGYSWFGRAIIGAFASGAVIISIGLIRRIIRRRSRNW